MLILVWRVFSLFRCYPEDVLWAKVLRATYKWPGALYRWVMWYYRHGINNYEYTQDEREYITRKTMLISERNWQRHTQV